MFESAPSWALILGGTLVGILALTGLAAGWNALLAAQTRRRAWGVETLNTLMAATQELDEQAILQAAAATLSQRARLDGLLIYRPELQKGAATGDYGLAVHWETASGNGAAAVPASLPAATLATPLYRLVLAGATMTILGAPEDPLLGAAADPSGRLSAILAPIPARASREADEPDARPVAAGLLIGWVRRPRRFTADEQSFFQAAGRQLGVALDSAALHQSLWSYSARLERARGELEEALAAKKELYEVIAHDFRSPLSVAKGYLDLLLLDNFGPLTKEQIEPLQIIARSVDSMGQLSADMGRLESIEEQQIERRPCQLEELVRLAARGLRVQAEKEGVTIVEDFPLQLPAVQLDPQRIGQVLDNFLGNALKYSPRDGTIQVKIVRLPRSLIATVSDQGPGIPPAALEKIWLRGYQVKGMQRQGGKGLGLAISKRLVEMHGGRVFVASSEGKGSLFGFELPLQPAKNGRDWHKSEES